MSIGCSAGEYCKGFRHCANERPEEDTAITAAAMSDPDFTPFTDEECEKFLFTEAKAVARHETAWAQNRLTL